MGNIFKDFVRALLQIGGRKNLYWVSRFMMRTARGDVRNDYDHNGEKMAQSVALRSASSPATVFDVGANVGDWTAGLLEVSERLEIPVHVYAFEPCHGTYSRLWERFGNSPSVTPVNQACSRDAGVGTMYVYGSAAGTNSLAEPIDDREAVREEVRLATVDFFCKAAGIEKIDLLKIDAEGYDFEVIAGAAEMLNAKAVGILQFEYNHRWIGARNYLKDVFEFLIPKGYAIGKLTGSRVEFYPCWKWELETWDEGNFIACFRDEAGRFRCSQPSWLTFERSSDAQPKI